jgi:hypothetical protein
MLLGQPAVTSAAPPHSEQRLTDPIGTCERGWRAGRRSSFREREQTWTGLQGGHALGYPPSPVHSRYPVPRHFDDESDALADPDTINRERHNPNLLPS